MNRFFRLDGWQTHFFRRFREERRSHWMCRRQEPATRWPGFKRVRKELDLTF
jgi:hypothetical protein